MRFCKRPTLSFAMPSKWGKRALLISLRWRLILTVMGLVAVPLLLVGAIIGYRSLASLESQSVVLQRQIAANVRNKIEAFIVHRVNELRLLDTIHGLGRRTQSEQRSLLSILLQTHRMYQELGVLDAHGQERLRLSRSEAFLDTHLGRRANYEGFQSTVLRNETYFGPVRFDTRLREPLLTVVLPLADLRRGEVIGMLIADLRVKIIWDLLARLVASRDHSTNVYVTDRTGLIVAHANPAVVLRQSRITLPATDGRAEGVSGQQVIAAQAVLSLGQQRLIVLAEQPVAQALALVRKNLYVVLVVTAGALVLAACLVVLTSRRIVSPIESLSAAARTMSQGDFPSSITIARQDEIGQLASAFNTMVHDLRHARETREHQYALELEAKNAQLQRDFLALKRAEERIAQHNNDLIQAVESKTREMEALMAQVVRQEKLATIGQISGSIAHELRNPLGAIKQSLFFLNRLYHTQRLDTTNPKVPEHLHLIEHEVDAADRVITHLLTTARSQQPQPEWVDLRRLLDEILSHEKWGKEMHLHIVCDPEPFLFWADHWHMEHIFLNLLRNAAEACSYQGIVTINAQVDVTIQQYVIAVRDTGCGIAADDLAHVFEPLYTRKTWGTGLGLSLCKQLIEQLGGTIAVESHVGQGTTFHLRLPLPHAPLASLPSNDEESHGISTDNACGG